jgi:hypothetical protein
MVRRTRRLVLVAATVLVCAGLTAPPALAGPTYSVMNAEGGIYWRSAPDWNTAVRVNGFGVYNGEIIEPHCYQAGAANVPGSADFMWEYASDVTGPGYGTGWINEHFINDGQPINQPSPGVPPCNPPPPPAPGVSTGGASEITQTSAALTASVNPNGGNVTDCHFEYGPTASYGSSVGCSPAPGSGGSPVGVSASISALSANSAYHFRVVATNAGGTSYGADATLATLPYAPTVVTKTASSVTQTSAILNATVNPNGGAVSSCTLEYGPTEAYGQTVPCAAAPGDGSAPVAVSASIGALSPDTSYHYRIAATNAGGTSYGSDATLDTLPEPPSVVTGTVTALAGTSATFNASVNPNGGATECSFEYGPTTGYGSSIPCSTAPGSGTSPIGVSADATGLSPNTTYHFRIVAESPGGVSHGGDQRFTTLGPPDFGRCVKVASTTVGGKKVYDGGFTSAKCNLASPTKTGKYEWLPGVAKGAFVLGLKGGTIALSAVGGTKITCTGATGSGQVDGTKELSGVRVTFTNCQSLSHPCTSNGEGEGTVATATLEGTLGWQAKSEQTVGLDLYPPGHIGLVMSFRCVGSTTATVTGSVIAPLPTEKMATNLALKFSATKGVQKPTHLEGEEDDVLIASLNGETTDQFGLAASLAISTEEAIEVNATA